jgi:predicted lipid carrier protein YhbT
MLIRMLRHGPPLPPPPHRLPAVMFAAAFNQLMRGQRLAARLSELQGKRFRLRATDTPWSVDVTIDAGRLRATRGAAPAHVEIAGTLADLWRLATRREDPDTLFFHRRLSMQGETETALLVKNLLDALEFDWEAHARAVLPAPLAGAAVGVGRRVRAAWRAR